MNLETASSKPSLLQQCFAWVLLCSFWIATLYFYPWHADAAIEFGLGLFIVWRFRRENWWAAIVLGTLISLMGVATWWLDADYDVYETQQNLEQLVEEVRTQKGLPD